jgi:hypothetical protein
MGLTRWENGRKRHTMAVIRTAAMSAINDVKLTQPAPVPLGSRISDALSRSLGCTQATLTYNSATDRSSPPFFRIHSHHVLPRRRHHR